MTFAWATNSPEYRQINNQALQARFDAADIICRYYNPAIHHGSFALPQYLLNALSAAR